MGRGKEGVMGSLLWPPYSHIRIGQMPLRREIELRLLRFRRWPQCSALSTLIERKEGGAQQCALLAVAKELRRDLFHNISISIYLTP